MKVNIRLMGDEELCKKIYRIVSLLADYEVSKYRIYRSRKNPQKIRLYFTVSKPKGEKRKPIWEE